MVTNHLDIEQLTYIRDEHFIFRHLSMEIQSGELLLITGENGSGKSSLLRLIAGLATPSSGHIFWQKQSLQKLGIAYFDNMHYVGHQNGLTLDLTVRENLLVFEKLQGTVASNQEEILTALQLHLVQHKTVRCLSAGQQRKLALARLLLWKKPLWILDEPCTALDNKAHNYFLCQLSEHLQNGGIGIMSTHQPVELTSSVIKTVRMGG